MPQVGFKLTIPVFKRAKTVHALDRAATVIGFLFSTCIRVLPKFLSLLQQRILIYTNIQQPFSVFKYINR
jgi:hypothetical protein